MAKKRTVTLPVLPERTCSDRTIAPSKSGRRRAIVLGVVQVLMLLHILAWLGGWFGDATLTPIEPSESMEFSKRGIINAGLIFFAVALLSTVIFGRWFCGWACHVVLLQDLCAWIMNKCGIRPKPFRSRVLIYVPLILALYMFIWPLLFRLAVLPWYPEAEQARYAQWQLDTHFATTEFWATFPGVAIAVPFLLLCGFLTVYFLGAKGYCTYGCPYGGFFAPLDEFAPGRIRVNDNCEQCGHCTAVCTSNVRVHEEVREYGMVVDPGCMKCMDCVSVCPMDALSFGFGTPAVRNPAPKYEKPTRHYDLTVAEDLIAGVVFFLAFMAMRGDIFRFPLLMAAGSAGVTTYMLWRTWRILRDDNANLHRFRMKFKGRIRVSGWVFIIITTIITLLTTNIGLSNGAHALAYRQHVALVDAGSLQPQRYYSGHPVAMRDEAQARARSAIEWYQRASHLGDGGICLLRTHQPDTDMHIAMLHAALLEYDEAEQRMRDTIDRFGISDARANELALILRGTRNADGALAYYRDVLPRHPDFTLTLVNFAPWAIAEGYAADLRDICRTRLEIKPDSGPDRFWFGLMRLDEGATEEGIEHLRRAVELDPQWPSYHLQHAQALFASGQTEAASTALDAAITRFPETIELVALQAQVLEALGQTPEAAAMRRRVQALQRQREAAQQNQR